jgi:hypothetical protein
MGIAVRAVLQSFCSNSIITAITNPGTSSRKCQEYRGGATAMIKMGF